MPSLSEQKFASPLLCVVIVVLLLLLALQQFRISSLSDALSARDIDLFNCDLALSPSDRPRQYLEPRATLY